MSLNRNQKDSSENPFDNDDLSNPDLDDLRKTSLDLTDGSGLDAQYEKQLLEKQTSAQKEESSEESSVLKPSDQLDRREENFKNQKNDNLKNIESGKNLSIDEPKKPQKGLVLGGGGAKGCYHVGAWEAFRELGIRFDAVTGTSIGALVGAFYVQQDIHPVVDFVLGMKPTEIAEELPYMPSTVREKIHGSKTMIEFLIKYMDDKMDITPLKKHFDNIFNYESFKNSPIDYACMTYNDTLQEGEAFTKDQITRGNARSIIMASAACYPAFPKVEIGDQVYMDGGYADNVPVELLLKIQPEADVRVVIDIHNPTDPKPPTAQVEMKLIQPLINPGNSLDFSERHALSLYHQGYLETMKYYDRFPGYLFTFTLDDWPLMQVVEKYLDSQMEQKEVVIPLSDQIENLSLSSLLGYRPFPLENRFSENYRYGKMIEALGLLARMEPVALYSYKVYLIEMTRRLSELTVTKTNESDYRMIEVLSNLKREELPALLHRLLVRNQGKFPSTIEMMKDRFPVSYALAYTWYFIEELTRNLQDNSDSQEKSS
ncbi:patatin-like phospholipase family protein [Ileibacterium valens]|uniref:patatin-like phospholipase family protein n=1 Tax=Ileibacterium valens TaxID=1862668 RepID=UPI0024BB4732|nr:patatin-like phospholipase family protein [Ileibacterium valens]